MFNEVSLLARWCSPLPSPPLLLLLVLTFQGQKLFDGLHQTLFLFHARNHHSPNNSHRLVERAYFQSILYQYYSNCLFSTPCAVSKVALGILSRRTAKGWQTRRAMLYWSLQPEVSLRPPVVSMGCGTWHWLLAWVEAGGERMASCLGTAVQASFARGVHRHLIDRCLEASPTGLPKATERDQVF